MPTASGDDRSPWRWASSSPSARQPGEPGSDSVAGVTVHYRKEDRALDRNAMCP